MKSCYATLSKRPAHWRRVNAWKKSLAESTHRVCAAAVCWKSLNNSVQHPRTVPANPGRTKRRRLDSGRSGGRLAADERTKAIRRGRCKARGGLNPERESSRAGEGHTARQDEEHAAGPGEGRAGGQQSRHESPAGSCRSPRQCRWRRVIPMQAFVQRGRATSKAAG